MEQAVSLLARTLQRHTLVTDEGRAVVDVVERYTRTWRLLLEYDERRLPGKPAHPRKPDRVLDLNGARTAIRDLRRALPAGWSEAGLFGHERGDQLGAILGNLSSPRVRPGRRT